MYKIIGYDKINGVSDELGCFEQASQASIYGEMLVPLIEEHRILSSANCPYTVLELWIEDLKKGVALIVM